MKQLSLPELESIAARAFQCERASVSATADVFDAQAFSKAAYAVATAGRIAASGCGHSGIACAHLAHLLCCIERPARFLPPSEAVHGGLGFLQEGDVMVLASRGGETDELLPIIDVCHAKGVVVVAVTENLSSSLACRSDIVLPMKVTCECDRYNSQGTASFVALASVFDALQAAVLEITEYTNDRFALIHPNGAVGKRLNKTE